MWERRMRWMTPARQYLPYMPALYTLRCDGNGPQIGIEIQWWAMARQRGSVRLRGYKRGMDDSVEFLVRDRRMPGHFWADNEVLDVFGPQLGEHGFCAYMVLCRHATNGTGECRISTRKLARQLGMSAGGAFNALATVLRLGLARRISPGDNARPGIYVLADVKALLNPDLAQSKFAGQGAHGVSAIAHPVNASTHHVSAVLTPRARNKESKRLSQDSKTGRLNPKQHGFAALIESESYLNAQAVRDWIAIKECMKSLVTPEEWAHWVRPLYLFNVLSGSFLLVACPVDGRIQEKAEAGKSTLRALGVCRE